MNVRFKIRLAGSKYIYTVNMILQAPANSYSATQYSPLAHLSYCYYYLLTK